MPAWLSSGLRSLNDYPAWFVGLCFCLVSAGLLWLAFKALGLLLRLLLGLALVLGLLLLVGSLL